MQSLLPGSGYQKQLLAAQGQLLSSTAQLQVELLQSQTKLSELEAQVRAAGQPGPLSSSWKVIRSITGRGGSRDWMHGLESGCRSTQYHWFIHA